MSPRLEGIFCLDFEASALGPGSFPIEVAVADAKSGALCSWLIRPTDAWLTDGLWSEESFAVHKITREELLRDGLAVVEVARALAARCEGKRILSDAADIDRAWLARLYKAAGLGPPFVLSDFHDFAWQLAVGMGRRPDLAYTKSELEAQMRFPMTHRAGADARSRAEMLRLIAGYP